MMSGKSPLIQLLPLSPSPPLLLKLFFRVIQPDMILPECLVAKLLQQTTNNKQQTTNNKQQTLTENGILDWV